MRRIFVAAVMVIAVAFPTGAMAEEGDADGYDQVHVLAGSVVTTKPTPPGSGNGGGQRPSIPPTRPPAPGDNGQVGNPPVTQPPAPDRSEEPRREVTEPPGVVEETPGDSVDEGGEAPDDTVDGAEEVSLQAAAPGEVGEPAAESLAETGSQALVLTLSAVALLGIGGALVFASRRRRHQPN